MRKITPTPEMIETISQMAADGKTQDEIATAIGVCRLTVLRWLLLDAQPEVKEAYHNAKKLWAQNLADDIVRQASMPLHTNPKLATAEVNRRRLIVDTSKWVATKLIPRTYGENAKLEVEHTGTVALSPLAQLRQLESDGTVVDITPPALPAPTEEDCF